MGIEIQAPPPVPVAVGTGAGAAAVQETPSTPASATAAANTAVVVNIAAVAGQTIRITHLSASYSGAPAGGNINVVVNAVTIFQLDIAGIDLQVIPLPPGGIICAAGFAAAVTLAAGGVGVIGKLNVASIYGP